MSYRRTHLMLPLLVLSSCGSRDEPAKPSTPAPVVTRQVEQPLAPETRRALIAQRLAKRPLSEALRNRLVEAWVVSSDGFDPSAMDRLLTAINSSIEAVDENRFNATKDLAVGHVAVAGSTIMGALISGLVADAGGRRPIAVDCGGIRANGWVERSGARSNRATVIITSLSVEEVTGKHVTYQHPDGLAYLMGPDGLEGLTLQAVTDQRGNSWLGLHAGTLVTLILIRAVDQSLAGGASTHTPPATIAPPAVAPTDKPKPATPAEKPAAAEPVDSGLKPSPTVPQEKPAGESGSGEKAPAISPPVPSAP